MMRETCICETPMRSPISACVRSSSKRRRSTSRSRGVIERMQAGRASRGPRRARSRRSVAAERVAERVARVVLAAARRLQRGGAVGARRPRSASSTSSSRRRRPCAPISATVGWRCRSQRQLGDRAVDLQRQLLQVARHAHRPRAVAEVALDLAEDRRHRVARERDLALEVEAVDRLDQAERRDLEEVVEGLLGALVAARELARERQEALDEHLAVAGSRLSR